MRTNRPRRTVTPKSSMSEALNPGAAVYLSIFKFEFL